MSRPSHARKRLRAQIAADLAAQRSRTTWTAHYDPDEVYAALEAEGVHLAWLAGLDEHGKQQLPKHLLARLLDARNRSVASFMLVERSLGGVFAALESAGFQWMVMKGLAVARSLYAFPHQRPFRDVDVLVSPQHFHDAQSALVAAGLRLAKDSEQGPHEQNLIGDGFCIDLHQDILRTGRSRKPLGASLVSRRVRSGNLWVPDDVGQFLTLTAHPTITEYATSRLMRPLDLHRWLTSTAPDWRECIRFARDSGLATACWAMLRHTELTLGTTVPPDAMRALRPKAAHRLYLETCLRADPASLYRRHPTLAQAAFQLAVADAPRDSIRAALCKLAEDWYWAPDSPLASTADSATWKKKTHL
jgi:hypothetical protein